MQERYTTAYLNIFMNKQVRRGGGVVGMDTPYILRK